MVVTLEFLETIETVIYGKNTFGILGILFIISIILTVGVNNKAKYGTSGFLVISVLRNGVCSAEKDSSFCGNRKS